MFLRGNLGETGADRSLDEARARVESLKAKLAERQKAIPPEPPEPVKTMSAPPPPAPRVQESAPQAPMLPAPTSQQVYMRPGAENGVGGSMKNVLTLLGVGLVAGIAVVILQRAFRRNN